MGLGEALIRFRSLRVQDVLWALWVCPCPPSALPCRARFPRPLGFRGARELSHSGNGELGRAGFAPRVAASPRAPSCTPGAPPGPRPGSPRRVPKRQSALTWAAAPSAAGARLRPAGKQPASPGQRGGGGHVLPVGGARGRAGGGPPGSSPGAGLGSTVGCDLGAGPGPLSDPGLGRSCWTD